MTNAQFIFRKLTARNLNLRNQVILCANKRLTSPEIQESGHSFHNKNPDGFSQYLKTNIEELRKDGFDVKQKGPFGMMAFKKRPGSTVRLEELNFVYVGDKSMSVHFKEAGNECEFSIRVDNSAEETESFLESLALTRESYILKLSWGSLFFTSSSHDSLYSYITAKYRNVSDAAKMACKVIE